MAHSLARQQEQQLTFLTGVAHDLRNPLSALKMSAALISSGRPLSEERLQKTMALVHRQVARLDRMVGELLDATRIEAGRFELSLEERDVRALASAVVEQALHNLVSNALKYSQTGSRVDVFVGREGEEAVLSVVDRGIGLSQEALRALSTPFWRAGRAREKGAWAPPSMSGCLAPMPRPTRPGAGDGRCWEEET